MKLRSLLLALSLGLMLCLAPVLTLWLPTTALWRGLARLAEEEVARTLENTDQPAVHPNLEPSVPDSTDIGSATAQLVVAKWSSPTTVTAGAPLTYTIVVTNTGPATARDITLYDTLPAGVALRGESNLTVIKGDNPQLQISERQVTATVATLQTAGHIIFIGRAIVDSAATGTLLTNTAQVTATNSSNSNNRATAETGLRAATPTATTSAAQTATPQATATLLPAATATLVATVVTPTSTSVPDLADLHISKSAAPDPVTAGAIVTYTIVVSNLGPGRAHNLVIHDTLAKDLFFDGSSSLTVLRGEQPQLLLSRTALTGTIAMLNVNGLITITAPVRAPVVMINEIHINQARVTATTPDPQPANNTSSVPVTLFPAPIMEHKTFLPAVTK